MADVSQVSNTAGNAEDVAADLRVSTYWHDTVPVVSVQGDVDLWTVPTLQAVLESCVSGISAQPSGMTGGEIGSGNAAPLVAVDLREVAFIDSAGLALLVQVRKRFPHTGCLALIVKRGSQPDRVLKLGCFEMFLRIVTTPEELDAADPVVR